MASLLSLQNNEPKQGTAQTFIESNEGPRASWNALMHPEKGVQEDMLQEKETECRSHRKTGFSPCPGDAER